VALRRQVVDLVGLDVSDQPCKLGSVGQVSVMEEEAYSFFMRVLVQVVDSVCVEVEARRIKPWTS